MSVYLVDYENVSVNGLDGIENLEASDRVYIFYGKTAATIPFDRHIQISNSNARVKYLKSEKTGKNYLDFQLSTYAGYLVHSLIENEFVIVSKDAGFDSVVDFWNSYGAGRKVVFSRKETLSGVEPEHHTTNSKASKPAARKSTAKSSVAAKNNTAAKPVTSPTVNTAVNSIETEPVFAGQDVTASASNEAAESASEAKKTAVKKAPKKRTKSTKPAAKSAGNVATPAGTSMELSAASEIGVVETVTAEAAKPAAKQMAGPVNNPTTNSVTKPVEKTSKLPERFKKEVRALMLPYELTPPTYTKIYEILMQCNEVPAFEASLKTLFGEEKGSEFAQLMRNVHHKYWNEKAV